jgi:aminopeptidase-like protein
MFLYKNANNQQFEFETSKSYRIIFIPETIGSIVYLSKNL